MVRTRFAPSPTGYLHIGGVRTALFNWLFARRHGGQFLLRIDDTDAGRNIESALAPILHGFRWLGIDWDEGPEVGGPHEPYFQSQRLPRYQAAVQRLLESGLAYRDFATTEELQAERTAAEQAKQTFVYSRRFMAETAADEQRFAAEGRQGVVRLKMPRSGKLVVRDLIRGDVEFEWSREQDHVIQRADGTCLYHLASVVDDREFEITHVIRAEEHLSNTPRQVFIAEGLGYPLPEYAHLPYVAEPGSKTKLSKRKLDKYLKNKDFAAVHEHGQTIAKGIGLSAAADTFNPVIVDFYEQVGYLPDAILNYLLLLGWSLDDKSEIFSREEMIANFSLERVTKAPASFDPKKLEAFQSRYMQQLPIKQRVAKALPFLQRAGYVSAPPPCNVAEKITAILLAAGDRIQVAGDILNYASFFAADGELVYDAEALDKRIRQTPGASELLEGFLVRLRTIEPFEAGALEHALHQYATEAGVKPSDLVQPLRVAATGQAIGFGLFEALAILGRSSCVARIERALREAGRAARAP